MVLKILLHNHPLLRTKCDKVDTADPLQMESIRDLIPDMLETMYEAPGYGLAANQIGENASFFIMDANWTPDDTASRSHKVVINPEILEMWNPKIIQEGCLSLPGAFVPNERYQEVKMRYVTLDNEVKEEVFKDMEAYVIQHEVEHLSGELFIDHFKPLRKKMAMTKYHKYIKRLKNLQKQGK